MVLAKVLILSIPEEEESLIDKIMAVVNSTQDEQGMELGGRRECNPYCND